MTFYKYNPHSSSWRITTTRVVTGCVIESDDNVVVEEPLEIRLNGHSVAITMRTPGNDFELVAGFLWAEQLVTHPDDILAMVHCGQQHDPELQNVVDVRVASETQVNVESIVRHFFATSGCGVCGKTTLAALSHTSPPVIAQPRVSSDVISVLPTLLLHQQHVFAQTGGLHAAGLFTATGTAEIIREDIGRHNAVDKVVGYYGLRGVTSLSDMILCVSGRAGFEIVQKAWIAQIPIVVAVSAASSLAIQTAMAAQITLIGFSRDKRFTIYTHPERILTYSV